MIPPLFFLNPLDDISIMLWLALRFPYLSLEAVNIQRNAERVCVVEEQHCVYACTQMAEDLGIHVGMKTSASRAFADVSVLARERINEAKLLQSLAVWAYTFTPYIQQYGDDCLVLEISRCLRLFGGVEVLCQRLSVSLNNQAFDYRLGLAHSRQGAWLLSHADYAICEQDNQAIFMSRIERMPLSYLREFPSVAEKLKKMGVDSIGELLKLPFVELGKRFGQSFIDWLRDLEGSTPIVLPQHKNEEKFQRTITFAYTVDNTQRLQAPATQLLQELVNFLVQNQLQANQIDWCLYSPQGQVHTLSLNIERVHSQKELLLELTEIRFEQLKLLFAIERIELRCEQLSAVSIEALALFDDEVSVRESIYRDAEAFIARMRTQLGKHAVYQLAPKYEHIPERQSAKVPPFQQQKNHVLRDETVLSSTKSPRPIWLFKQPKRIECKANGLHLVASGGEPGYLHLIQGPERIEGQWWQPQQRSVRDYFIAEHQDRVRYWVYHDWQNDHWYAHGVFA